MRCFVNQGWRSRWLNNVGRRVGVPHWKAGFPCARFRWRVSARVSAKWKMYFHARGNASAESRNFEGETEKYLPQTVNKIQWEPTENLRNFVSSRVPPGNNFKIPPITLEFVHNFLSEWLWYNISLNFFVEHFKKLSNTDGEDHNGFDPRKINFSINERINEDFTRMRIASVWATRARKSRSWSDVSARGWSTHLRKRDHGKGDW